MRCPRLPLLAVSAALIAAASAQEKPANSPSPASSTSAPETFAAQLALVRYDSPIGRSDGYAPTRQLAQRKGGDEAIDWPDLSLNGRPIFRGGAEERVELKLRRGADAAAFFNATGDDVIQPGNHWLRAFEARADRRSIYTADDTARAGRTLPTPSGRYELWTFAVTIKGEGGPVVKNVELKSDGQVIFRKPGPWRSLTLLLPASEPGHPYELAIDGRPAVKFQTGLMPVKLGDPREREFPIDATIAGEGPKITVSNLGARPFPNPKEWAADVAALANAKLPAAPIERGAKSFTSNVGAEVPRSPLTIYAAALPHGMSHGFWKKGANAEAYSAAASDAGFDVLFEQANALPSPDDPESFERRASAFAHHGLRLGLAYDNNWSRPSLQNPHLPLLAHALPDWHAPLYRSLSLAAQRFSRLPNFAGISIGADTAGFAPPSAPSPERPWGEAIAEFGNSAHPKLLRLPAHGALNPAFEAPAQTAEEFFKFTDRLTTSFRQYGYFSEALREIDPQLVFTTASFTSAGRGGWPGASLPGRVMSEALSVQQAFDANDQHGGRPLQCVALTDRLRSYFPAKRTWALLDNFQFRYNRESWQRAVAMLLTRGIQGLGTNALAQPDSPAPQAETRAFQKEMHDWVHRYGGVFAHTEPIASVGIFFSHQQALLRPVLRGSDLSEEQLLTGSHEAKVTEALFICHAAGWPARVITYQELMRGPLPASMKVILLVGLDAPDETWNWARGLDKPLQQFLDRGGRILADAGSFCPVKCDRADLKIAAYEPAGLLDLTPQILGRNTPNIAKLQTALEGVPPPLATTNASMCWLVPTQCGDTQYLTALNQRVAEGEESEELARQPDVRGNKREMWRSKANASLWVPPAKWPLQWHTQRPIYDVRLGRKLTADEAATADFSKDSFRWYALPPAEIVAPSVTVAPGVKGFYEGKLSMQNGVPMRGLPVEVTVSRGGESATVYSATGWSVQLPFSERDAGTFEITARELITGLTGRTSVTVTPPQEQAVRSGVTVRDASALAKFATRKHVALTIALTPEQERDPKIVEQAKAVAAFYRTQKRVVATQFASIAPGGVVESLQPLASPHRYPQWKTAPTDLVLLGSPSNNVLMLDQARGQLFPRDFTTPAAGEAAVLYTRSPFVGEYDVVNIVASDVAGITAAVKTLTAPATRK